jgi:hypothetical protein
VLEDVSSADINTNKQFCVCFDTSSKILKWKFRKHNLCIFLITIAKSAKGHHASMFSLAVNNVLLGKPALVDRKTEKDNRMPRFRSC